MKRHRGRRIGLLGGSFNPPHEGHRHISLIALKRLGLDEIWWLVSPQNPLKGRGETRPLAERMRQAAAIARHPRIRISDLEARLGTRFTADTLTALRRRYPGDRFVWLMGADNLKQIPRWRRWQAIFAALPICVLDRGRDAHTALRGRAAQRYRRARRRPDRALVERTAPAWAYLFIRRHAAQSRLIRAGSGAGHRRQKT